MTTTDTAIPATVTEPQARAHYENAKPNFGNGPLSRETERYYNAGMELFKMTSAQAEKFARQAASDVGAAIRNSNIAIKLGKTNDDGKGTISQACKTKGVHYTDAMNIVRAIDWVADAGKNNVSYGHTGWKLVPTLQAWVDKL